MISTTTVTTTIAHIDATQKDGVMSITQNVTHSTTMTPVISKNKISANLNLSKSKTTSTSSSSSIPLKATSKEMQAKIKGEAKEQSSANKENVEAATEGLKK